MRKLKRVKSIAELKKLASNGVNDYFIALNGGLRSSKNIVYNPKTKKFKVINLIDDTVQSLTEKTIGDKSYTNIGYAIKKSALYQD